MSINRFKLITSLGLLICFFQNNQPAVGASQSPLEIRQKNALTILFSRMDDFFILLSTSDRTHEMEKEAENNITFALMNVFKLNTPKNALGQTIAGMYKNMDDYIFDLESLDSSLSFFTRMHKLIKKAIRLQLR
jgi:hypothetical protein